jgi:hypothetical protein
MRKHGFSVTIDRYLKAFIRESTVRTIFCSHRNISQGFDTRKRGACFSISLAACRTALLRSEAFVWTSLFGQSSLEACLNDPLPFLSFQLPVSFF